MRRAAATVAAVAVLALVGCSEGSAPVEPLAIDGGSETPAAAATPTPSPTQDAAATPADFDGKGHEAVAGLLQVRGPAQREVAEAWLDYWQVRLDAFHAAEVDPARLGEVASGEAADQVIGYAEHLAGEDLQTVGDMRLGVDQVAVKGDRATLRSCTENKTVDRNSRGRAVEPLSPFFVFRGRLVREGGAWRVSDLSIDARTPC